MSIAAGNTQIVLTVGLVCYSNGYQADHVASDRLFSGREC